MTANTSTPWHKASYTRFLDEWLPEMLAERLPLMGYAVTETSSRACRVIVGLPGGVEMGFDLPTPDAKGIFQISGELKVVVPIATDQELDKAEILCVGEQLRGFVGERLGAASADLPWDETLARAWLPLDTWVDEFLAGVGERFVPAQRLEQTNWLATHTHLRRIIIPDREDVIARGQLGVVCPFETPEGPNIGHVLTVALGAEIRDGRLVALDDRPAAKLGLTASMVPFLEHDDTNRLLMGVNMLRQWLPQGTPEPALVRTGNEPDPDLVPDFWCGRNLLTAFVSWGTGTYEDAIVVSASCAQRFDAPYALEFGDKLANRHGTKGVVGRILPDDEMPHLPDGTPVDLVYSFANAHRRVNFGQVREALAGWIAKATGEPMVVPPFGAPSSDVLRDQCREAGLPVSGMATLTMGKDGPPLELPSAVGYVYWGRLYHVARGKLHTFVEQEPRWGQRIGEMEIFMLRDLGAYETVREALGTRSIRHPDAGTLSARVAAGPVAQADPPTPLFAELQQRLRVAGIDAVRDDDGVAFSFVSATETGLELARPVSHPWMPERELTEIGLVLPDSGTPSDSLMELIWPPGPVARGGDPRLEAAYNALVAANDRLTRMLAGDAPSKLVADASKQLQARVETFCAALLTPVNLRLGDHNLFTARTVMVPGDGLSLEQLGLPDNMAWDLFGPMVERELSGNADAVENRTRVAEEALDAVMARSWVVLNRAPSLEPTALIAFHPVRVPGHAMHFHPLLCKWLNGDFDGDQAAIYLPITEAGQREAGERLSVAAHLARDPGLIASLAPALDMLFGLAWLSRQPGGLDEIARVAGMPVDAPGGFVTQDTVAATLAAVLARDGVGAAMDAVQALMALGLEVTKRSGASISPFLGESFAVPPQPRTNDVDTWFMTTESVAEALAASTDYDDPNIGPQLLMSKARGSGVDRLAVHLAGRGPVVDFEGVGPIVRHGYVEGLTPDEIFDSVVGARRGLGQVFTEWRRLGATFRERNVSRSFNVLTRALRARHPGLVFARAAANGEVDPLTDVEARMLVGLPV